MTDTPAAPEPRNLAELLASWGEPHSIDPNEPRAFIKLAAKYSDLLQLIHRLEARVSDTAPPKLCADCGCELECVKHGCAKKYSEYSDAPDYSGKNPRCAKGCPEDTKCDYDECPGRAQRCVAQSPTCPYCADVVLGGTFYDQTCAGCVARMGGNK